MSRTILRNRYHLNKLEQKNKHGKRSGGTLISRIALKPLTIE